MEETKEMTPQQSLDIIRKMMNQSRKDTQLVLGKHMVLWGSLTTFTGILTGYLWHAVPDHNWGWLWLVMSIVGFTFAYILKKKTQMHIPSSYITKTIGYGMVGHRHLLRHLRLWGRLPHRVVPANQRARSRSRSSSHLYTHRGNDDALLWHRSYNHRLHLKRLSHQYLWHTGRIWWFHGKPPLPPAICHARTGRCRIHIYGYPRYSYHPYK